MNWQPVARKEFRDLIRSKGVWLMGVLITIGAISYTGDQEYFILNRIGNNISFAVFQHPVGALVPLAAILIAYRSIAGERATGSIKFAVGFPQTRRDVLIGKVVGQTAALSVPLVAAFVVGGTVGIIRRGLFSPVGFAVFVVLSLLYTLVNVSIATGISAAVSSPVRAAAGTFGYFLIILTSWARIRDQIYTLVTGRTLDAFAPPAAEWIFLFDRLSPTSAYYLLTNKVLGAGNGGAQYFFVIAEFEPSITTNALVYELIFTEPPPFYLTQEFGLVILGLWIVLPTAIGYRVFSTADLT